MEDVLAGVDTAGEILKIDATGGVKRLLCPIVNYDHEKIVL
jgi:hypothetical protein